MDTRAPWAKTREWASGWAWTLSFWAVTALSAVAALFLGLSVTGDWSAAAGWAVVGVPLGVGITILWRWASTPWRDLRELALELADHLQNQPSPSTESGPAETRRRSHNQFRNHVDTHLDRLRVRQAVMKDAPFGLPGDWDEFDELVMQAIKGIELFDPALAKYVEKARSSARFDARNLGDGHNKEYFRLADRVIDAVEDTKGLY